LVSCLINAYSKQIYVSQSGAGAGTGVDIADAYSLSSLNNTGNWGSGGSQINPGDTLVLMGGFTSAIGVWGNDCTVLFSAGSYIAPAAAQCIYAPNVNNLTINGAGVGYIANTANGTGLANQVSVYGIMASGASNVVVENLVIQNLYVHTNISDGSIDIGAGGGFYANGMEGTLLITGCTFSNIGWCINLLGLQTNVTIVSNSFANYDHGVALGPRSGTFNAVIASNQFGSTVCWDTGTNDWYHHDGIHYYGTAAIGSFAIGDNLFYGNWGSNNSAQVYLENSPSNVLVYNCLFVQYPSDYLSDGMMDAQGNFNHIYNNTFMGSGVTNSTGLYWGGTGSSLTNNIFSGLTTFVVNQTGTMSGSDYNIFCNATGGGNTPFADNGTNFSTLATWRSATGQDAHSTTNAPLLNPTTYVPLASDSVAHNQGDNLSAVFTTDSYGNPRPASGPWDIGACEDEPLWSANPDGNGMIAYELVTITNSPAASQSWLQFDGDYIGANNESGQGFAISNGAGIFTGPLAVNTNGTSSNVFTLNGISYVGYLGLGGVWWTTNSGCGVTHWTSPYHYWWETNFTSSASSSGIVVLTDDWYSQHGGVVDMKNITIFGVSGTNTADWYLASGELCWYGGTNSTPNKNQVSFAAPNNTLGVANGTSWNYSGSTGKASLLISTPAGTNANWTVSLEILRTPGL
jgi:hypothetical protein